MPRQPAAATSPLTKVNRRTATDTFIRPPLTQLPTVALSARRPDGSTMLPCPVGSSSTGSEVSYFQGLTGPTLAEPEHSRHLLWRPPGHVSPLPSWGTASWRTAPRGSAPGAPSQNSLCRRQVRAKHVGGVVAERRKTRNQASEVAEGRSERAPLGPVTTGTQRSEDAPDER